jgi:hypothetical protein
MNIYEQDKQVDADYYDPSTGYIYKIEAYNRAIKFGLPTLGINIIDSSNGELIGYAKEA